MKKWLVARAQNGLDQRRKASQTGGTFLMNVKSPTLSTEATSLRLSILQIAKSLVFRRNVDQIRIG
ncbi:hypothetical protein VB10N_30670 [Vibrio sp. 10N]|nr:hypothetical protein VB10N_30670 [Vibrio sp. 10N]